MSNVDHDLRYQKREWRFERIGWTAMAIVVVAAVLGFLGPGILNSESIEDSASGVSIDYERRLHHSTCSDLRIRIPAERVGTDECRLWLSREYLDRVHMKLIIPESNRVHAGSDGHTFFFQPAAPNQPIELLFRIEPEKAGALKGQVRLNESAPIAIDQFVFP